VPLGPLTISGRRYRPSASARRNPVLTSIRSAAALIDASAPHSRRACALVSERPGRYENSSRSRRITSKTPIPKCGGKEWSGYEPMYEAVFRVDCVRMPDIRVGMGFQCGRIDFKVKAAAAGMRGVHVPSLAGAPSAPPGCCAPLPASPVSSRSSYVS